MKKTQTLLSLLIVPIITISGCMNKISWFMKDNQINNNQIKIKKLLLVYRYSIENEEISLNYLHENYILEIKKQDNSKIIYIGNPMTKKLNFIKMENKFGERYPINLVSGKARQKAQEQYENYLNKIFEYQRERFK